jgi:hypothetical protein
MLVCDLNDRDVANSYVDTCLKGFICNVTGDYLLVDQEGNKVKTHLVTGYQYFVPYVVNIETSAGAKVAAEQITVW